MGFQLRQDVRHQRAALNGGIGRDGPNLGLESNNRVDIGGRAGRGAMLPASRGIRGESDASRWLRIVAGGIAGTIGVRDDTDCGIGTVELSQGIGVAGEGVVP